MSLYLGAPTSPPDCLVALRVSIGGGRAATVDTGGVFSVRGGLSYVGSCIVGGAWLKMGGGVGACTGAAAGCCT